MRVPVLDFCGAIGGCLREAMVLEIRCVNNSKYMKCCFHKHHKLEILKLKLAIAQSTI